MHAHCFCGIGGGGGVRERGERREYASKVVDIKRMTKNPNPGFFIFLSFLVRGQGRAGQERCWQRSIAFFFCILDTLYQSNTYCFTFS